MGSGHVRKYFLYALGEIALVVIGILIALKFNNVNQDRLQEKQFKVDISRMYNSMTTDLINMENGLRFNRFHRDLCDAMLEIQELSEDQCENFVIQLFELNMEHDKFHNSDLKYYVDRLTINPGKEDQVDLGKDLVSFTTDSEFENTIEHPIKKLWKEVQFPVPAVDYQGTANPFTIPSQDYLTNKHRRAIMNLAKSERLDLALKQMKHYLEIQSTFVLARIEFSKSIIEKIKKYNPDVKSVYKDIGILGSALNGWNGAEAKMIERASEPGVWETTVDLKEGALKFRSENNWEVSWGGHSFPNGTAVLQGTNIDVQKGRYQVVFDINTGEYSFDLEK